MHKLCRIDISRSENLHERIKQFVSRLASRPGIRQVYLFGSVARDDFNEGSDIDIAIIGDFKERFLDRCEAFFEMTDLPIEPLCYTESEFETMKKSNNPFVKEILKGRILFDNTKRRDIT